MTEKREWFCLTCGAIYPEAKVIFETGVDSGFGCHPCKICNNKGYSPLGPWTVPLQAEIAARYEA